VFGEGRKFILEPANTAEEGKDLKTNPDGLGLMTIGD